MTPILALDLGTKTGASTRNSFGDIKGFTWKLASDKQLREARQKGLDRAGDIRVPELGRKITEFLGYLGAGGERPVIVFEDVQFLSSQMQSQLWASFRTVVWVEAEKRGLITIPVPVGTLKKFATGHGGATKEMMAASLSKVEPGFSTDWDDNQVDARWLRRYAEAKIKL